MFRNLFNRTDFLLFIFFLSFLTSLILTICKCIKKAIITFAFALATILFYFFLSKNTIVNINFLHRKFNPEKFSKICNQQPPHQSPPTTSQENPTTPKNIQNPQSSTRISIQDIPYTFDERHARLSETLEPVVRQASLSKPQYTNQHI